MAFVDVRPYQPGDDVRAIDWNVTARMGQPYLKRFVEERELTVQFVVDASASLSVGTHRLKREVIAELAALLAFAALHNNDRVGLLYCTDRVEHVVPPRKGARHASGCFAIFFSSAGTPRHRPPPALDAINRAQRKRAIVFLFSDFLDSGFDRALRLAGRRHDLVAIWVRDPLEDELPDVGLLDLADAETGEQILIDTGSATWRRIRGRPQPAGRRITPTISRGEDRCHRNLDDRRPPGCPGRLLSPPGATAQAPMIVFVLSWLAAADPLIQPNLDHKFTRHGIACTESVSPTTVALIGEVNLTLTAEGEAPLAVDPVTFPDPSGWRIRGTKPAKVEDRPAGRQQWGQSFRLTPDRPGDLPLPPPTIRVRTGGREIPIAIDWPPLTVRVTTTLSRANIDEARGVTGPESAPPAPMPLWKDERAWAVLLAVAAVIAALWAGRRHQPPPAPEPPPAEWAIAELDRLATSGAADNALANLLQGFSPAASTCRPTSSAPLTPSAGRTSV